MYKICNISNTIITISFIDNQELKGCISTSNFAVISECNSLNKEPDQSCHICDSDLCNSAASYHLPVILLLSLAALSKIF
jgi:hypothetical protein